MSKPTPGPWSAFPETQAGILIAAGDYSIGVVWDMNDDPQNEANARLIAAAPELLEALKNVLVRIERSEEWWMDCPDRGGFDRDMISAAIAKAEGRS